MHRRIVILAAAVAAFLSGAACDHRQSVQTGEGADLLLRTYEVPAGAARQLRQALREVFWMDKGEKKGFAAARAELSPDGRLVILASASIHEGVAALVKDMARRPFPMAQSVDLTYWLVVGSANAKPPAPGSELQPIGPALAEIVKGQGEMQFTLVERLRVRSLSAERGEAGGRGARVEQMATVTPDGVIAEIHVSQDAHRLKTRVRITAGQTVVLGATGYEPRDRSGSSPVAADATLYYIIQAATPDAAATQR